MPNAIYIRRDHPQSDYAARLLRQRAGAFLTALDLQDVELSISLVDDTAIAQLNAEWRHKPQPTDVLSFPAGELPPVPGLPRPLGDVVISLDTARRRALLSLLPAESQVFITTTTLDWLGDMPLSLPIVNIHSAQVRTQ